MNIFKILANGYGSVNENNISAFLGYLLDPNQDHGLGHEFLHKFLNKLDITPKDEDEFNTYIYDYQILFENNFTIEGEKSERVDIVILCLENNIQKGQNQLENILNSENPKVKHVFLIESKIDPKSLNKDQVKRQYKSAISQFKDMKNKIYSIYLTPFDNEGKFIAEFDTYKNEIKVSHLFWNKPNNSIVSILSEIIENENKGEIDILNEYSKSTIKSFIQFVENNFKSEKQDKKDKKDGTYTMVHGHSLNEKYQIEEKLNTLKTELINLNPDWENLIKLSLGKPTEPMLFIEYKNIHINIYAGYSKRDKVSLSYNSHSKDNNAFNMLNEISEKLKIDIKKKEYPKDAYARTDEMIKTIPITDFKRISDAINKAIAQIEGI